MVLTCPITFHGIENETIYESNNYGPFKIIEDLGTLPSMGKNDNQKSRHYVKIQFINTGTTKVVRSDYIKSGYVYDELYCLNLGKVFYNIFYGPYTIVSYEGTGNHGIKFVRIRFLNTGYSCIVSSGKANIGDVSDKTVPRSEIKSTYGTFSIVDYDKQIKELLKSRWDNMMRRCYDPKYHEYCRYGALGVTVNPIWHTVEGFLQTIESVDNYNGFYINPMHYQLDKDFYQRNKPMSQREYGPSTCIFLTEYENSILARLENHKEGELFGITKVGNGCYKAEFTINNNKITVGTFDDLNAAISAYEQFYAVYSSIYNPNPSHYDLNVSNIFNKTLPKGFKSMTNEEFMKHKVK